MKNDLHKALLISLIISTISTIFYISIKITELVQYNIEGASWVTFSGKLIKNYGDCSISANTTHQCHMDTVNNISVSHIILLFAVLSLIFTIYIYGFLKIKRISTSNSISTNNEGLKNGTNN